MCCFLILFAGLVPLWFVFDCFLVVLLVYVYAVLIFIVLWLVLAVYCLFRSVLCGWWCCCFITLGVICGFVWFAGAVAFVCVVAFVC